MRVISGQLKETYGTVHEFLNDFYGATGQTPVALYHLGSLNGRNEYMMTHVRGSVNILRELKPEPLSFFAKLGIKFGFIDKPGPVYEPAEYTPQRIDYSYDAFTIQVIEFKFLLDKLLVNRLYAHRLIAGYDISSDMWVEGIYSEDPEYAVLYDYASRGIQDIALDLADMYQLEVNAIDKLKELRLRLAQAAAAKTETKDIVQQYAEHVYVARNYRLGNILALDRDNLIDKWLPEAVFVELSEILRGERPMLPSKSLQGFVNDVIEIGPDPGRSVIKPRTARPEKKIENFYMAVSSKLDELVERDKEIE